MDVWIIRIDISGVNAVHSVDVIMIIQSNGKVKISGIRDKYANVNDIYKIILENDGHAESNYFAVFKIPSQPDYIKNIDMYAIKFILSIIGIY